MDRAKTRRGQTCWYLQNNIGLSAINDGLLLEQAAYQLLKIHFQNKSCYPALLETIHEVTLMFEKKYHLSQK